MGQTIKFFCTSVSFLPPFCLTKIFYIRLNFCQYEIEYELNYILKGVHKLMYWNLLFKLENRSTGKKFKGIANLGKTSFFKSSWWENCSFVGEQIWLNLVCTQLKIFGS